VLVGGRILPFVATALAIIVVPGPSVLFIVSRALTLGRRAALATVVGNEIGEYLQVIAVALGLGLVLDRSVVLFSVVKIAGAAYLAYLGLRTIRDRNHLATVLDAAVDARSTRRILREGVVVGASNPKTAIFLTAILPHFVDRSAGHIPVQLLSLGLVFFALALICDSLWGLFASRARSWFTNSPRRLEMIGGAGGLVIIGLSLKLALTGRQN
jgi:threonine/homoserine/homoserine lactone efflux protein